jgi:hypothetical protein
MLFHFRDQFLERHDRDMAVLEPQVNRISILFTSQWCGNAFQLLDGFWT